jgi:PIN domain nuclease of toxin-antitoxin system
VKLLLDSHALVWWFAGDERLPLTVRTLIDAENTQVYVSAASAWELGTKFRLGKMPEAAELVLRFFEIIENCDFKPLPVSVEHGHRAGLLPGEHKDPFDRMLAAQSIIEDMGLVTLDRALAGLGARVVW